MASTYVLNGTVSRVRIAINGSTEASLDPLDFSDPDTNPCAQFGLGPAPNVGVLGKGSNQVVVTIGDAPAVRWLVEVGPSVQLTIDVQLLVFENTLQLRNTYTSEGFTVTREVEAAAAKTARMVATAAPVPASARELPTTTRAIPPIETSSDAALSFTLAGSNETAGLYTATNNDSAGNGVAYEYYYLFLSKGQQPPTSLDLQSSWDAEGAYVFSDAAVDPSALLGELGSVLSTGDTTFSRVAWRLGPASYQVLQASTASAVAKDTPFAVGTWQLLLRERAVLSLDAGGPAIAITNASGSQSIEVQAVRNQVAQPIGTRPSSVSLALDGDHRGAMILAWDWSLFTLGEDFGGNLRLFYGEAVDTATIVQYPVFTPAPNPGPRPRSDLFFFVYLQPLAPLDDQRTRLSLDLSQANALSSQYYSTTTNAAIALKPAQTEGGLAAGYGFAINGGGGELTRYLCPVGEFEVSSVVLDGNVASTAADSQARVQIRAGLASTEYVIVEPGDRLCFRSSNPAFAAGYDPNDSKPASLDDKATTSWVEVRRRAQTSVAATETIDISYGAQSATSTYFGATSASLGYDFPIAVGVSLVRLATVEQPVAFPMLPYGGVFYSDESEGITNPNPNLSAAQLGALEGQVVAGQRRAQLEPVFDGTIGPIVFDASTNVAFDGGGARTPLGLLVTLNSADSNAPAGTVERVILARSPQNQAQFLELRAGSSGTANPTFVNTVFAEDLFLVATDQSALAPFDEKIQLGDFTFKLELGPEKDQAIAVFSFVDGVSTRTLINSPDRWTTLIGDDSKAAIYERLQEYLKIADEGGELFAAFRTMIDDPNWNGILFFNAPLDYASLPLDIQILLGGIEGPLLGHHFGVTINRVDDSFALTQSSLFAVIHYQAEFVGPDRNPSFTWPNFQVLLLDVRYANSKLATFDSTIAFSINQLFGNPAKLVVAPETDFPASGTMVIAGVYTTYEDGTGSLLFSTQAERSFELSADSGVTRVLTTQSVTDATLVPVEQRDGSAPGSLIAASAFELAGVLAFADDIGGDLFSYGDLDGQLPKAGLAIVDYAFAMETTILGNDAELGPIDVDLTGLKVDQGLSQARDGSLEQTFPGQVDRVDHAPTGLRVDDPGMWRVAVGKTTFTAAPIYSLVFEIPLGNLGDLSSNSGLNAELFVGWVPGGSSSRADDVGLVLYLPPDVSGPSGFGFEGVLSTNFESVRLDQITPTQSSGSVYMLRFIHYQGFLLNLLMTYNSSPSDLGLFGPPDDPGGRNALWYLGKSTESWSGPSLGLLIESPRIFLGRSIDIKSNPTDPNVIKDVFKKMTGLAGRTVEDFIKLTYLQSGLYNDDAGISFGIQFDFIALAFTGVFIDSSFYGAQVQILPIRSPDGGGGKGGDGGSGEEEKKNDKSLTSQLKEFTFTIIYRKVSDTVGVYSADIYLNLGKLPAGSKDAKDQTQINAGGFQLSLPNFSISIWTNGDWRFAIGWPFDGAIAHPITVQFQAGPVPVIGKLGFYLAKLSSAAAPDQLGNDFKIVWQFGAGLAAGVGKDWQSGPLSANATIMLGLTVQGMLASKRGDLTDDGVDYWWWAVVLSLTASVGAKVDFVLIVAQVSLSLRLSLGFAIETGHSTPLTMTFEVKATASVRIFFIKISFSFSMTLTLFSFTFGDGPVAKLDGPTPTAISAAGLSAKALREAKAKSRAARMRMLARAKRAPSYEVRTVANVTPTPIAIAFVLQVTSVSSDASVWAPQGVATLVTANGDLSSPFGLLASGLAEWLLAAYGGVGSFSEQLENVAAALAAGEFNDAVETCLSTQFVFNVASSSFAADQEVVSLPMVPSLSLGYAGQGLVAALAQGGSFSEHRVAASYLDLVRDYFSHVRFEQHVHAQAVAGAPTMSLSEELFNNFYVMLANQLIYSLQETKADSLPAALALLDLGDLGGFGSRFLLAGQRFPDPQQPNELRGLYALTGQQFALVQKDGAWVLDATLRATGSTPAWVKVADNTSSSLAASMVHTTGPAAPPWAIGQLDPLTTSSQVIALNDNLDWTDSEGKAHLIARMTDGLSQLIRRWVEANGEGKGPWLVQTLATGDSGQQVDLADGGPSWTATAALAIEVKLAGIPDPGGEPGAILADVFSLLGTNEASRTQLQALLDDESVTVDSVTLLASPSSGKYVSTKVPQVLVRTDLSTSNSPPGGSAALARAAVRDAVAATSCSNYAKLRDGGDQLRRFLRLLWEVSVVHSTGFYLQVEGLDLEPFASGPVDFMIVVQFGNSGAVVEAKPYQNALVGAAPEKGAALFSTLAKDAGGTPAEVYGAGYPGGDVGWSITWPNAPVEADASSNSFLQGLYQLVSYRVEAVNGQSIERNWSSPVTALDEADGDSTWRYIRSFPTNELVGAKNRYAAVGDVFTVRISIEDVFGNSLPASLLHTVDLTMVYNDSLIGLGDWAGTNAVYLIDGDGDGGVELKLTFALDRAVVQDTDGNPEPDQLAQTLVIYEQVLEQLTDPNTSAALDTTRVLAASPLTQQRDGSSLQAGIVSYVQGVVAWLEGGGVGNAPTPTTLLFALDKSYPSQWPGDLQELNSALIFERAKVLDDIAELSPSVRSIRSPLQVAQEQTSVDDPTGMTSFALGLEQAYFPFDGKAGVIKVATGQNAELDSQLFGRRSVWLMRWGADAGVDVEIKNDEGRTSPVFFAPPPLSTQLITRQVPDVRTYTSPTDFVETDMVFSSVDLDLWASAFLSAVETIFSPQLAPAVADNSSSSNELYDPFVDNKTTLAGSISNTLDYVYDELEGTGDPSSARETWRQALLATLENDYGYSVLTQLEAMVSLRGSIEPSGDPKLPPQVYGAVQSRGVDNPAKLPYAFTPATVPLVAGRNWLNFLVSARDPAAQRAFTLDLDYQINQLEHLRDGSASACGYTPSSWLTFVLQQNPSSMPQGQSNTLTAPIGTARIPIPLRSYPPQPKLIGVEATQNQDITAIGDAMTWNLSLRVERSNADQDTLNLLISFNVPQAEAEAEVRAMAADVGRPAPADLFEALARFTYEYPQLEPYIQSLPEGGQGSVAAVQAFSALIGDVATAWSSWSPPVSPSGDTFSKLGDAVEVWSFAIQDVEDSTDLEVVANGTGTPPPWPTIEGYKLKSTSEGKAIYSADAGRLALLSMTWPDLYILDYQNARPAAYTERNRNLAPPGKQTNPDFVYRTQTVAWPSTVVPLVAVPSPIELGSGTSLASAITAMLVALDTVPTGARSNGSATQLEIESSIDYRYLVLAQAQTSVTSLLPVFLVGGEVEPGSEQQLGDRIAANLSSWQTTTGASSPVASFAFRLTVFATTIVSDNQRLPLVQFSGLIIPIPDSPSWWGNPGGA